MVFGITTCLYGDANGADDDCRVDNVQIFRKLIYNIADDDDDGLSSSNQPLMHRSRLKKPSTVNNKNITTPAVAAARMATNTYSKKN